MNQLAELPRNELKPPQHQHGQLGSLAEANLDQLNGDGGIDVWGILARRKWLVILGCIVGLGLAYVYLLQADPVYESTAQVLIEERKPPTIPLAGFDSQMGLASAEAKHAHMIMSPTILYSAFDDFGLRKLPTFAGDEGEAMKQLSEELTVELVEEGTNLINLSFRGPNPDDTQSVVNSVLLAYHKFLKDTYENEGNDTKQLITEMRNELWTNLEEYHKQYSEFRKTAPLVWLRDEAINVHQERQVNYEQERVLLRKKLAETKSRLVSLQAAIERKVPSDALLMLAEEDGQRISQTDTSHAQAARMDRYLMLRMELEDLTRRYGNDHPDVISVRTRISEFEQIFPEVAEGRASRKSEDELADLVRNYSLSLEQTAQRIETQIAELDRLFDEEDEGAKQLQAYQAEEEFLREQIENTEQTFNVIVKGLEEVSLVEDYEGYTYQRLAEPGIGEKVAPMPLKVMPIGLMLGGLAGFGLAYLVDSADKAFRTPDEVGQIMRVPVVGHIPLIDIANQKTLPGCNVQPVICTVHRPKSPQSESYRAVRTALYFNNRDQSTQVIQVTSPMPGDGKSTLCSNLAVTIAQSGKRVLIMDADFRRPTLHKVFDLDKNQPGLASVVSGDADPEDAMQSIPQAPTLRFMACGPRPSNPSELLSSEQFANVLDMFREQFDYVLVDTPPVLAVSDPCAVAARVDGVLLTFRIHKRARPLAVRARDALQGIGANILGVVVNGVDQEAGGYYSQYRYGYTGYRYAYNYRQQYGYGYGTYGSEKNETKAIKQYFDDDKASVGEAEATKQ